MATNVGVRALCEVADAVRTLTGELSISLGTIMSSDIERLRGLALTESARLAEEKNKVVNEARRLAQAHLPMWSTVIEKLIRKGKSPKFFECEGSS